MVVTKIEISGIPGLSDVQYIDLSGLVAHKFPKCPRKLKKRLKSKGQWPQLDIKISKLDHPTHDQMNKIFGK